ncbi:MAG: hypothetical protein H7257_13750 [Taibaiella sp.]|nr:hypothetical protein [Taibaiella sp.]
MANKHFTINLSSPCMEKWDAMTETEQGWHCKTCQVTVVDYTLLTDSEIMEHIKQNTSGHTCGRFHPSQLNRTMTVTPAPTSWSRFIKKTAAVLLLAQSVTHTALAQLARPKTHQQPKTLAEPADNRYGIRGYIKDYATKEPVPDTRVQLGNTTTFAFTDKHGYFFLPVPESDTQQTLTVTATQAAYSKAAAPETLIQAETADPALMREKGAITLYRYPVEHSSQVVTTWARPLVERYGGFTTKIVEPAPSKHNFRLFKRKKTQQ